MSEYLQDLALVLKYYDETNMKVDFESGKMFLFSFGKDKKDMEFWRSPVTVYGFSIWEFTYHR